MKTVLLNGLQIDKVVFLGLKPLGLTKMYHFKFNIINYTLL